MNLIQQEKDLQSFSDQALLQEAMQPTRGYAPYMVQTEIARRTQERNAYQKQMMAQQAQEAVPVAQQNVDRFVAQNMAAMQQPAQMPQATGIASMAPPQMEAAAVDQAFMDAQAQGIGPLMAQSGMPVQGMSEGGSVRRMQVGQTTNPEIKRILAKSPVFRTPEENQMLASAGYELTRRTTGSPTTIPGADLIKQIIDPAGITGFTGTFDLLTQEERKRADEAPTLTPSSAPIISPSAGIVSVAPRDIRDMRGFILGGSDTQTGQIRGVPVTPPRETRRQPPRDAAVAADTTPLAAPASAAATTAVQDTYYADLLKQMEGFKPSREEFERERQAALLANLGALVGGATRRGDIAAGIGQLVSQQIAAGKEFKKEEREALRDILAIRGQERAETREERRYQQNLKLEMDKIDIQRRQLAAETQYRMQAAANDAERNEIAKEAAATDKLLIDTRKRLAEAQADYYKAQAEYYRTGRGDQFNNILRNQASSAADLEAAGL